MIVATLLVSYSIIPDDMKDRAFIIALRAMAKEAKGVDVVEASVTELIAQNGRVFDVKATKLGEKEEYRADLVVTDGCVSNFRMLVMGFSIGKSVTRSHFVGAILEDVSLPIQNHGTVALVKGFSPVLLYQIGEHDTQILIDVKVPLPPNLTSHILDNIIPQLPPILQQPSEPLWTRTAYDACPTPFFLPCHRAPLRNLMSSYSGTRGTCSTHSLRRSVLLVVCIFARNI